jgi:hypothetical protein
LLASLAHAIVVAAADLVRDAIAGAANAPGLLGVDRRAIYVADLIGTVLFEEDVDTIEQMRGAGTNGLQMVFAAGHHLLVINGGDLNW